MVRAKGPTFKLQFKRRRKNLTNYERRLALIKSRKPRLVVRLSNNGCRVQVIDFDKKGDIVIADSNSLELKKYGWISNKNAPTVYLTTLLTLKKAKQKKIDSLVLDIGRKQTSKGAIVFACAKAALDSGVKLPYDDSKIDENRVSAKLIAEYAKKLAENQTKYKKVFSHYIKAGIKPEELDKLFLDVKSKIES